MKKIFITISAGFLFGLFTLTATAQEDVRPVPSWVSDRGYWVVESHGDSSTVYFYNNENQLVFREKGKAFNAERRKNKLWLTRELEKAVTAWSNGKGSDSAISRQNTSVYRQMMNGVKNDDAGQ